MKQKKNTLENREIKITEKEEVLNEPKILLRDSYSAFAEYEEPTEENYSQFIGRVKKMFGVVAPVDHIDVVRDQKVYRYTNDTVFKITPK